MSGCYLVSGDNLDEVPSTAVNVDIIQLQSDDLVGFSNDESSTGQLWLGCNKGEVSISGEHVQAPYVHAHTHKHTQTTKVSVLIT